MILAINKSKGPTSFQIISQVKRATGIKRVGHAGTLDPLASGVLVVAIERKSTRLLSTIVDKEKEYVAKVKFGMTSSTDDEEGEKTKVSSREPSLKEIEKAVKKFIGKVNQVPPKFSAIKISGKRAYKMARMGIEVKMKSREVLIKDIEILKYKYPILEIKVICGPGVYIRALSRDIGEELGVGAYMAGLIRTRVGEYDLKNCFKISEIKKLSKLDDIAEKINSAGVVVMPTDTIYGLLGQALNENVVQMIYNIKKRSPEKPFIILISSLNDLKLFDIKIDKKEGEILEKIWPGMVSVVLNCKSEKFKYLHRGTKTLAFRLPDKKELIYLLRQTGPLIAPSANPEEELPAQNIKEAKKYFGKNVDLYISGKTNSQPSTLVKIENDKLSVLRQGAVKIDNL